MEEDCSALIVTRSKQEKRIVGDPRRRWMGNVSSDFRRLK